MTAIGCVRLGLWQLDRLEQRQLTNAVGEQRLASEPVSLETLLAEGAEVTVFDPIATGALKAAYPQASITYATELLAAVASAAVVVIMTRWAEFKEVPALIAGRDPQPLVVDGRRMLEKTSVARYEGIGLRETAAPQPKIAVGA